MAATVVLSPPPSPHTHTTFEAAVGLGAGPGAQKWGDAPSLSLGWRSLFDVVIVSARKPDFFTGNMPVYEVGQGKV